MFFCKPEEISRWKSRASHYYFLFYFHTGYCLSIPPIAPLSRICKLTYCSTNNFAVRDSPIVITDGNWHSEWHKLLTSDSRVCFSQSNFIEHGKLHSQCCVEERNCVVCLSLTSTVNLHTEFTWDRYCSCSRNIVSESSKRDRGLKDKGVCGGRELMGRWSIWYDDLHVPNSVSKTSCLTPPDQFHTF